LIAFTNKIDLNCLEDSQHHAEPLQLIE